MYLTKEEEKMLNGEMGYAKQIAMEILVALGKIYNAEKMIPVKSTQISGVSYKNLGEAGLEWLEEIARDGRVEVLSTLNPAGVDLEDWGKMGVDEEFVSTQKKIVETYVKMGVQPTLTCTPYYVGNKPQLGDNVAWSESSAIIYVNSVIGARTNREGGPSALASALTGRTPYYGLHVTENRAPSIEVHVPELRDEYDYALLGYFIGKMCRGKIPLFKGVKSVDNVELKALGAALASSGDLAIFHIEGLTPEYTLKPIEKMERIEVEERDLREARDELNDDSPVDLVFIGCPHASLEEIVMFMEKLNGRQVRKETWICTSRSIKNLCVELGVKKKLEELGVKILADTCPVIAPIEQVGVRSIATNSAKGAWYSRNLNKLKVKIARMDELVEEAVKEY
ncbi:MAG: aconitase X catalytic domain-containing protein [Nitrososphaerota archaeon]